MSDVSEIPNYEEVNTWLQEHLRGVRKESKAMQIVRKQYPLAEDLQVSISDVHGRRCVISVTFWLNGEVRGSSFNYRYADVEQPTA